MAIDFQCSGCNQWYQVPDRAAGRTVACPSCAASVVVPDLEQVVHAAPMMLDDDDEEDSESVTAPQLPNAKYVAAIAEVQVDPADADSIVVNTSIDPSKPPVKEREEGSKAEPVAVPKDMLFDDDATELARSLSRPALLNYIMAAVIVVGLLTITVLVSIQQAKRPNPLPEMVAPRISPSPQALAWLGERKSSFLYSFQLPSHFAPSEQRPSVEGFPENTIAHSWVAEPGGNDEGSTFSVWVVPKVYDVERKLDEMESLDPYLGYPTKITERSSHARIGSDMVGVKGVVDGGTYRLARKGVIYLIAHEDRTIMIIAMAVGPSSRQGQAVLNAAAGTIEVNTKPKT